MNQLRNSVHLIGNLGRDPEFKSFDNGNSLARCTIATKEVIRDAQGEKKVYVQWHNIIGWGPTAENMRVLLKKGTEVAVKGKLTHRSYQDKEGVKKRRSEVIIQEFMLLGAHTA